VIAFLLGCTPKAPPPVVVADPAALVAAASEPLDAPVAGRLTTTVITADKGFSAVGLLLLAPGGKFRLELRGPIGPPQLVVTCNGVRLAAYVASKDEAWVTDDARDWLGGAVGPDLDPEDLVGLLAGRLPTLPTAWVPGEIGPGWLDVSYARADGMAARARLDAAASRVRELSVASAESELFRATIEPAAMPRALDVTLPSLGARAEASFSSWEPVAPTDAAFSMTLPATTAVHDLAKATSAPAPPPPP
jgi:hypothetical protein